MKINKFMVYSVIIFSVSFSGCILDSLNEMPLDIPIEYPFSISGDAASITDDGSFCLTQNELYNDYMEKIKDIKLLEITFRPTAVSPTTLNGDVRLEIKKGTAHGELLFSHDIESFTPASYLPDNPPYVLPATENDFKKLNDYLSSEGLCFYVAVAAVSSVGQKSISGKVDFIFRTKTDLN